MNEAKVENVDLAYQRKDRSDDKKPKRDGYGIGKLFFRLLFSKLISITKMSNKAQIGNKIFISGGYNVTDNAKYDSTIFMIDLESRQLEKVGALPYPRAEHKGRFLFFF